MEERGKGKEGRFRGKEGLGGFAKKECFKVGKEGRFRGKEKEGFRRGK